ncbi:hypothetical protein TWF569_005056 [Orbilia oligospora]|uniref:Uncharacterized protein n=2 Tax=Orbilia oligospora TaxID=2813651 RepID=A0A7C8N5U4_ORBOL|nr:hypothetical protein TWF103_003296 [Orbilia oligospora]KAF3084761.1 hypothetical protein TWF706_000672 [Orbilia oligospora]KAF3093632.1 hypothetical protein TWF102_007854 [Orbilia oligospora]KAF3125350.1 hypothetical protein TWF594_001608 [Orbilia oligospora]KAF3149427.1 hypothetical protein TWF569_005056 [Orbilia oligospora]
MQLPLNEAFSGIFGSISLTSWMFLIVPQLWENFRNQSAEGLSTLFLIIWLLGDICNLTGALWAHLLPTVVALGIYFCLVDFIMLAQLIYYNHYRPKKHYRFLQNRRTDHAGPSLSDPLLPDAEASRATKHSGPQRRDSLSEAFSDSSSSKEVTRNAISVFLVVFVGTTGWFIAWKTGAWGLQGDTPDTEAPLSALILGYASSFFYLTARLPQIYTNAKRQSCSGLSILFFILSTVGNLTYGASVSERLPSE